MINKIKQLTESAFDEIVEIRRHIHKNPELSFKEHKTSAYIKSVLTGWGIPFTEDIADTGIVVLLEGNNPSSKTIALRADFDALPITEENEVDYCSVNKGVMHACGHDAHTASMLGAVKILNSIKQEWEGSVKFIFQPAEEMLPGGAQKMIKEGVLENPKVEKMIGQHVFPDLEVGKVGFCSGKYMASTDELHITINGKGGHAALPEKYNNPLLAAAKLILDLESSFVKDKELPSVLAIGFIEGLGSTNVIPDKVKLKGTLRAMDEDFRATAHKRMQEIAKEVANSYNLEIDFDIRKGYPLLVNDVALTESAIVLAKEYLGTENVIDLPIRMTAEDFAYYSHQVPSCFYRLGTRNEQKGIVHGLHTSKFNIDEESLKIGMGLMAYLAIKN
ncbi:MAG: M20 family metallopeptidase [Flavobacteriales bacterium]|nr:M20 family metallopeptidase [Flavobacteriales bacterium]